MKNNIHVMNIKVEKHLCVCKVSRLIQEEFHGRRLTFDVNTENDARLKQSLTEL